MTVISVVAARRHRSLTWRRDVLVPQHREVRVDELVGGRQVQPDLEELGGFGRVAVEQREHLGVHDAAAGGEPLHVAPPEAAVGAERVGVVDEPLAHEGDGLEAPVRVLREAGHDAAVVHAPAVDAREVPADVGPSSGAAGPRASLPAGYTSRWCTQNRNGSTVGQWDPSGTVCRTGELMTSTLSPNTCVRNKSVGRRLQCAQRSSMSSGCTLQPTRPSTSKSSDSASPAPVDVEGCP